MRMLDARRAARGEFFQHRAVGGLRVIVSIEWQCRAQSVVRVRSNPGIFVGEAPHLDRSASRTIQTGLYDAAIHLSLAGQVGGTNRTIGFQRQRNIELSKL